MFLPSVSHGNASRKIICITVGTASKRIGKGTSTPEIKWNPSPQWRWLILTHLHHNMRQQFSVWQSRQSRESYGGQAVSQSSPSVGNSSGQRHKGTAAPKNMRLIHRTHAKMKSGAKCGDGQVLSQLRKSHFERGLIGCLHKFCAKITADLVRCYRPFAVFRSSGLVISICIHLVCVHTCRLHTVFKGQRQAECPLKMLLAGGVIFGGRELSGPCTSLIYFIWECVFPSFHMQSSRGNEGENMRMEWSSELNVSLWFEQCDYKNQSDPKAQQLNKQTLHQKKGTKTFYQVSFILL